MISLRAFALCVSTSLVLVLPAAASAQQPGPTRPAAPRTSRPRLPRRRRPRRRTSRSPAQSPSCCPTARAAAPADAPPQVQQAICAANKIQDKPYIYGGGHGDFEDDGYDCSGTVSYALHGGGLLDIAAGLRQLHELGRARRRASGSRSTRTPATPTR